MKLAEVQRVTNVAHSKTPSGADGHRNAKDTFIPLCKGGATGFLLPKMLHWAVVNTSLTPRTADAVVLPRLPAAMHARATHASCARRVNISPERP